MLSYLWLFLDGMSVMFIGKITGITVGHN